MRARRERNLSRHQKFFCKNVFHRKAYPLYRDGTIFGQVFVRGGKDEFSIFARPPPRGGLAHARPDDLEAFPSGLGHAASGTTYLPYAVTLPSLYDCAKKAVRNPQAKFIRMKSTFKKRTPSIVNLTVKRRYP